MDLVTAVAMQNNTIFQALLGTPPRHPLLKRALEHIRDRMSKDVKLPGLDQWMMGPFLVAEAMTELYETTTFDDANYFACKGVFLLKEVIFEKLPQGRSRQGGCEFGLEDVNGLSYGFSRVKKSWGSNAGSPCQKTVNVAG
jgi:hypothetical protein